jgi:PD-(D/E)XK endonuclease
MSTGLKGNATEAAVLNAFVARGYDVLIPFGEGQPYDLVAHLGSGRFLRVQCKTGWSRDGCVVFNGRSTDHGRGRRPYLGLADVFGVLHSPSNAVFLVPVKEAPGFAPRLRLGPARNNQKRGIRFASDYEIDRWTPESLLELVEPVVALPSVGVSVA